MLLWVDAAWIVRVAIVLLSDHTSRFSHVQALLDTARALDAPSTQRRRVPLRAPHSQAITAFCDFSGTGPKMRQNLIRVAKENGSKLGFLS